jgi:hypothetical protein
MPSQISKSDSWLPTPIIGTEGIHRILILNVTHGQMVAYSYPILTHHRQNPTEIITG